MVLAELGRKITTALQSLSKATIINEEVGFKQLVDTQQITIYISGPQFYAQRNMCSIT